MTYIDDREIDFDLPTDDQLDAEMRAMTLTIEDAELRNSLKGWTSILDDATKMSQRLVG